MDSLEEEDWDDMAFRLSKFVRTNKDDDFKSIKDKLQRFLTGDTRGQNLLKPSSWRQVWREVVPRILKIDETKKRLFVRSGGKDESYNRDRQRTAKKIVQDFDSFEKYKPNKVDMDGIDTKGAKFVK